MHGKALQKDLDEMGVKMKEMARAMDAYDEGMDNELLRVAVAGAAPGPWSIHATRFRST